MAPRRKLVQASRSSSFLVCVLVNRAAATSSLGTMSPTSISPCTNRLMRPSETLRMISSRSCASSTSSMSNACPTRACGRRSLQSQAHPCRAQLSAVVRLQHARVLLPRFEQGPQEPHEHVVERLVGLGEHHLHIDVRHHPSLERGDDHVLARLEQLVDRLRRHAGAAGHLPHHDRVVAATRQDVEHDVDDERTALNELFGPHRRRLLRPDAPRVTHPHLTASTRSC